MTQKELNYFEDVYNHEKLIVEILYNSMELVTDEDYVSMFDKQIEEHDTMMKKMEKFLGDIDE